MAATTPVRSSLLEFPLKLGTISLDTKPARPRKGKNAATLSLTVGLRSPFGPTSHRRVTRLRFSRERHCPLPPLSQLCVPRVVVAAVGVAGTAARLAGWLAAAAAMRAGRATAAADRRSRRPAASSSRSSTSPTSTPRVSPCCSLPVAEPGRQALLRKYDLGAAG
jgi:hypothetical protein